MTLRNLLSLGFFFVLALGQTVSTTSRAGFNTDAISGPIVCIISGGGNVTINAVRDAFTVKMQKQYDFSVSRRESDGDTEISYVSDYHGDYASLTFSDRGDTLSLFGRVSSITCPQN